LWAAQPALGAVVLSENFDNIYVSSNSATQNVCINSTCATIPAGLTAGTTANSNSGPAPAGASTAPDTANIRRGDNTINLSAGVNGFNSAFATTTANRFLVLGDDTNTIADGSLNGGISFTRIPFSIALGDAAATISFAGRSGASTTIQAPTISSPSAW
jgi:hypothetical protein